MFNDGRGFFEDVTDTHLPFDSGFTVDVAAADMNGDGKLDLLISNHIIDHNFITQYVTQGILSRHLLRFGAGGKAMPANLGIIHDTEYDPLGLELKDYIEHRWFHTDAWVSSSILVTAGGVVISDLIIRPIGRIIRSEMKARTSARKASYSGP